MENSTLPEQSPILQQSGNEEGTSSLSQYSLLIGESHLCRRCEDLILPFVTKIFVRCPAKFNISKETLRDNCQLCDQFLDILKRDVASNDLPNDAFEKKMKADPNQFTSLNFRCDRIGFILPHEDCLDIRLVLDFGRLGVFRFLPEEVMCKCLLSGKFKRRRLGNEVDPQIPNYKIVKDWLSTCQKKHGSACSGFPVVNFGVMRLIDCESRTIYETYEPEPYICLSYLWGNEADSGIKSVRTLARDMPKVVEDAIKVTLELGIRYLWVDRYCIDQQNQDEKHNTIRQMDKIYKRAALTIIAAAGNSPHYGLPGVRGTPRESQYRLQVGYQKFYEARNVADDITDSKWNTRGWTLQEMVCSSRRLVFTSTQIYFQCQQSYALESSFDSLFPTIRNFEGSYQAFPAGGIGGTYSDITYLLKAYYRRQLSFKSDIIDAFTGVFDAFDQSDLIRGSVTHFYGIPILYSHTNADQARNSFIDNLHWKVYSSESQTSSGPNLFPSWSWASVKALYPADAPGELDYKISSEKMRRSKKDDIAIRVSHQSQGPMSISAFTSHPDDYKHFSPWIDISTWVKPVITSQCSFFNADRSFYYNETKSCLDDHYTPSTGVVCLVRLRARIAYDTAEEDECFEVAGMLVQETSPGLYRRIGLFDGGMSLGQPALNSGNEIAFETESMGTNMEAKWQWRSLRLI